MKSFTVTKATRNPPRRGRERSLSFSVRIVSGIQAGPKDAGGVRHAVPRIVRLYPQGESCRKSPDREQPLPVPGFSACALFQCLGALDHFIDVYAAERARHCPLGLGAGRTT